MSLMFTFTDVDTEAQRGQVIVRDPGRKPESKLTAFPGCWKSESGGGGGFGDKERGRKALWATGIGCCCGSLPPLPPPGSVEMLGLR